MSDESLVTTEEEKLCDSSEFMRTLFESAPDSIVVIDGAGKILRVNAQTENLFQFDRHELLGQPVETLLPERYRDKHREQRETYCLNPQMRQMGAGLSLFARAKDGTEFPVDIMLSSLKASSGDMVIAVIRDVSERKESEKALRETEETLRLLVEGVQDYAIFMLDCNGIVSSWNAGAQNIKGYEASEIIGSHFSIFYTDADVANGKPERELDEALRCSRCHDEGLRKRKDGSTFWADVTITRVQNELGKTIGFSKVTRDISDRKNAFDALVKLSKQREDFVATLTHDLKTPVFAANRAIKFLVVGDFGPLTAEQVEVLQTISESNDAMLKLITTLLDVYRYEGGAKQLSMKKHDLVTQIGKIVQELNPIAISQKVALIAELPPCAEPVVCDSDQIRRVIQNLIDNALKFTKSGGKVKVAMQQNDRTTVISVTDTGKGIASEEQPKLFQRFWAPADSGRKYASTGLGLYLCRKIVESHAGAISCESELGRGSKFSFSIDNSLPSSNLLDS